MSTPIKDVSSSWVLIPIELNDAGEVVYRKHRVHNFIQKGGMWSDEIDAIYADFEFKKHVELVTLDKV